MNSEPADVLFPAQRPIRAAAPREPRIVGADEYLRLLLSRRPIDRIEHGLPRGFQGLRDPRTGQTWMIREDALLQAS